MSTGNRLGVIVVPASGSQNNKATAVPFNIPFAARYVAITINDDSSGYSFRTGTGSSLAATSSDLNQVGPGTIQIPLPQNTGSEPVLAIYTAGAGDSVEVYESDGLMQS